MNQKEKLDAKTILIVDDDVEIRDLLGQFLLRYNFKILAANDGIEMFEHIDAEPIDLIILDMMLPGDDGITLCRKLQAQHSIPIVILSAAGEETDRIIGLEVGADDYISKPFNPRELLARMRAILRRSNAQEKPEMIEVQHNALKFVRWTLNLSTRQLISPEQAEISLSAGEYDLLVAFLENPKQVLSRDQLLDLTKHRYANAYDRSIDMQVSRLRQKMEDDPKKPKMIKTVRGGGYIFAMPVSKVTTP
jgi:two-component system, OmpR family, response regulator